MPGMMFTVLDAEQALHGRHKARFADTLIPALSDDPETIEELRYAMRRFVPDDADDPWVGWSHGDADEPADGGICLVDLPGRLIVFQLRHDATRVAPRANVEDFGGKTPAQVIECERLRLPMNAGGEDVMVDADCPLCQMMAESGTVFWGLDGCHMDDDFPFALFEATREEWEESNAAGPTSTRNGIASIKTGQRQVKATRARAGQDGDARHCRIAVAAELRPLTHGRLGPVACSASVPVWRNWSTTCCGRSRKRTKGTGSIC